MIHRIPPSECPRCGKEIDAVDEVGGDAFPSEGEFSICFGCLGVNVFNPDLTLRLPTKLEEIEIAAHDELQEAIEFAKRGRELEKKH
jgi:hypothetical protein